MRDLSVIIKLDILAAFRNEVLKILKARDPKAIFKKSTGQLLMSVSAYMSDDRLIFNSTSRHFGPQEYGVKAHTMWYLLGKTIPLRGEPGEKPMFRKCTLKSLMNGKWRHPGSPGKFFVHEAIDQAMERLPSIVSERIYAHTGVTL